MNLTQNQVQNIQEIFKKNQVLFGYIFGSQVSGKTNAQSDFDFAVFLPENMKAEERFDLRLEMAVQLGAAIKNDNVDLIVLNDAKSILLKFVVISEGKLLFEKDHAQRVDFEAKTMREFYDFKPTLALYNQAFMERALNS